MALSRPCATRIDTGDSVGGPAVHFCSYLSSNREPTSGLEPLSCSLRVITQALQGVAQGCKCRIDKPVSFLSFARCCTVLRSR